MLGVRRSLRLPLVVHVHSVTRDASPRLLLVACNPELSQVPPASMLGDISKLTPAEASIAVGIASGKQVTKILVERRVKIETVRIHTKSVFGKTQTRGQAELAAPVTGWPFWSSSRLA